MTHFAAIAGEQEFLIDRKAHLLKIKEMVEQSGHSFSSWRPEEATTSLRAFLKENLRRKVPVALLYMGHGSRLGWHYKKDGVFLYWLLARWIAHLRQDAPTAIVNACCYASSIKWWLERTNFDKQTTIALTASIGWRTASSGEIFESNHEYRVLKAWLHERRPFDPFEYDDSIEDRGYDDPVHSWPHWIREGPERMGNKSIDTHFFSLKPST